MLVSQRNEGLMNAGLRRVRMSRLRRGVAVACLWAAIGPACAQASCPSPGVQPGYTIALTVAGFGGRTHTRSAFVVDGSFYSISVPTPQDLASFMFDTRATALSRRVELHLAAPGQLPQRIQVPVPGKLVTGLLTIGEITIAIEPGERATPRAPCRLA